MLRGLLSKLGIYKIYGRWLRAQIHETNLPEHIGVIVDGNRRWALSRNKIPWEGHKAGAEKVKKFIEWCLDLGVTTVTLYGFSTENFSRPEREVKELMNLYEENLKELLKSEVIHEKEVKISVIGRINLLPQNLQLLVKELEEATGDYEKYYLNVALAYGGRAEIVDATKDVARKIREGILEPKDITEDIIEDHLYTAHLPKPDPDLIIRTSEMRLSNFLVWQGAYSELFILDVYWPDFREIDLHRAIRSYQKRHRRHGR
jgi:tritrans,polycis-undecaprenyl-diphosphate synthase [geranylgeranyl-diphosphate specific]